MNPDDLRTFAAATEPDARVLARVEARATRPSRVGRRVVAALAIAATVTTGVVVYRPPERVDRLLADHGVADLGDAVHARWEGSGSVTGDARAVEIAWEQGDLAVDVDPGRGVRLRVVTGEGTVAVVGTGFDVRRDALGTRVDVRHGTVEVRCGAEPPRRVSDGASSECLPVTPAAWLGRARALERSGAGPEAVIEAVDHGERGAEPGVAAELGLLRAVELVQLGRREDALAAAEAALSLQSPARRVELLRLAASLAVALGGCERAAPHTAALAALGEPTPCPTPEAPR